MLDNKRVTDSNTSVGPTSNCFQEKAEGDLHPYFEVYLLLLIHETGQFLEVTETSRRELKSS